MRSMNFVVFLLPIVTLVAVFTFVTVASWAENRRKEREAAYRSEVLKKLVDQPGAGAQSVLEFIREEERAAAVKRREGLKLGGLITAVVGIGISAFLFGLVEDEPVWLVGVIPFLVGVVILIYVGWMAPKAA
jgi:hypothetical protein